MRKLSHLLLAALPLLAACTPDGYTLSPAVGAYFQKLVPAVGQDGVALVSVCNNREGWGTTVMFEDKVVYHYGLDLQKKSVNFVRVSTSAQRALDEQDDGILDLVCIGYRRRNSFSFTELGAYRFMVGSEDVTGYVLDSIAVNRPFDDSVKQRLAGAAMAVADAITQHKKFIPVETTWGVTP